MKKIAFLISSFFEFGGEQRVLTEIANALSHYYNITIYTSRKPNAPRELAYLLSQGVTVKILNERNIIYKFFYQLNRRTGILNNKMFSKLLVRILYPGKMQHELSEEINSERYDVVVGLSVNAILAGILSNSIEAKTVGWIHNTYEAYFNQKERFKNIKILFDIYIKRLDKCIVLNQNIQAKYSRDFDIKPHIIYNPRSFISDKKSGVVNPLFVACGRFTEAKGFDLLINSFKVFAELNKDWELTLIGDGPLRSKIEKMIIQNNLSDRVQTTGFIKNVQDIMLNASIFLMPSRWEGFPMTVTEALELGLPVIAYDIIAMGPLVENGKEGLIVPSFDINAFAEMMLKLALDESERKRMSRNAIAKAKELSIENISAQWVNLIEEITSTEI